MRLFLSALILPVLICGGVCVTAAQSTTGSRNGGVTNKKPTDPKTSKPISGITKIDFRNFTYPLPSVGNLPKSVTLKNGTSGKKDGAPNFTLRKTYYFDLTGDNEDEAITQIIADGCQMGCESSSLFYVHTAENDQAKLLWKIAIGGDILGGLKAAHFRVKEFVIETFGNCSLEDWLIKPNIDLQKNPKVTTNNYSRFVFSYEKGSFASAEKTVLPLESNYNTASYRPKISFGEPE